ncbi:MAG TPA: hypothetical protein DCZ94_04730 [Lentisphaeria bacterium]|nr:MAG: hypothetical protein A2X48_20045 [Lentisphaerae bacterium GWF2_49_21]HBC86241.1 hypothetical protein [Lentisphaeria bacterium]
MLFPQKSIPDSKWKIFINILVFLFLFLPMATGEEKQREKYFSEAGHFSFTLPNDWSPMPDSKMQTLNNGKTAIYQFQGGFIDDKSSSPKVYMLLQVKQRPAEPVEKIEVYKKAAIKVDNLSIIADVIIKKEYRIKKEFYSPKHDVFLMITGESPQLSVMVKKFASYGYFIMHFYLGNDPGKHLQDIELLLSSIHEDISEKEKQGR